MEKQLHTFDPKDTFDAMDALAKERWLTFEEFVKKANKCLEDEIILLQEKFNQKERFNERK